MRRSLALLTVLASSFAAASTPADAAPAAPQLPAFTSCTELVDYARRNLSRPMVPPRAMSGTPIALGPRPANPEPPPGRTVAEADAGMPIAAAAPATTDSGSATPGEAFSTTNVQEAGIDEPDVVKTNGRHLFVVAANELWAFDVTGDVPKTLGKLNLEGAGGEILLRGDRVLLIGPAPSTPTAQPGSPAVAPAPPSGDTATVAPAWSGPSATRLMEIDVSAPAAMRIARAMTVPGQHITARLTGGTARVVLTSPASLPQATTTAASAAATTKKPGLGAFVPKTTLRSRITKRTYRRALVPCRNVRHPDAYSGNDLLTVLTVNLDAGLFDIDRDAVMAGAQVVYGSATSLYVASQKSAPVVDGEVPEGMRTEIHRFDASRPGQTTYASSGSVAGFVLNNYALSEYQGDLRVATTEEPQWLAADPASQESQSAVTVLRESDGRLAQIGRVGGLGRGERIYAARFIGDVGYLVTFRQVDPLYTLDLRDPTQPKVVGELKITGYSAYLHPIGEDLLLGVGQEATEFGQRLGSQVSVFDVSDPARPRRLHQKLLGSGSSYAEFDSHAFLWWPQAKLALLPYEEWSSNQTVRQMVGLRAGRAEGLTETGRITHGPGAWDTAAVQRSIVVGDRVLTVSDLGVASHRIGALAPLGFLPFVPAG